LGEAQANFDRLNALPKWAFRALAARPIVNLSRRLFLFASSNERDNNIGGGDIVAAAADAILSEAKWLDSACHEAQNYETRHAIWR
jgi:hypothetical protein